MPAAKRLTLGGAVVAALVASSCCIGPLVLAALGVGGAGALAAFGAYRPFILGVTVVLLAAGFYLTYRKPRACGCERRNPTGLWIATVMVAIFATAPNVIARVARHPHASTPGAARAHLRVRGMDCEACAVPIRSALTKVGGFHDLTLDLPAQTITVDYEPAAGRLEAYTLAINELGYEASAPLSE
jgi:mercuric ion transport protein